MTEQTTNKQQEFLELYEPIKDRLWRYVRSIVRNAEDAKDIEAETIMLAFQNLHKLKARGAFLHFLFGIAHRLVKQKERKMRLWNLFKAQLRQAYEFNDPNHSLDAELLYQALNRLPLKQREAVVLFEISGFSLKEIQEIQNDSLSAVKSRISRGRKKLAQMLNAEDDTSEESLPERSESIGKEISVWR